MLAVVVSGFAGAAAYFLPAVQTAFEATGQTVSVPSPAPTPSRSGVSTPVAARSGFTVLLLGSDDDSKFPSDHVLTQSMILVRVSPETKQVTMLSIPRDLYVPIASGGSAKIDAAYSYGGSADAIATVQNDFGVHIDEYVWIGLKGLIDLINAIGGIDIVASNPVMDDYHPSDVSGGDPFDYTRVAVLSGPQHLNGTQALEYVRSRHDDLQSDFGRSQRQQQVLLAIRAKAKEVSPSDIPALAQSLNGEIKTSMGISRVTDLVTFASGFDPDVIQQVVLLPPYTHGGATVGDQSVVSPNWNLILPLVHQYFP